MAGSWRREEGERANIAGLLLVAALSLCFVYTLLVTAWLGDDAYITWRTVDNLVHGLGLRWNTLERVQAFTHPLWLFVNAAAYALTGEGYRTWIGVSMLVSALAALTLVRGARRWGGAALALSMLLFSRAFMDYCGSGLENPLTSLLIALFVPRFASLASQDQISLTRLAGLSLVAGLATLNRMDTLLLFLPCLIYLFILKRSKRAALVIGAGFLPFLLWELFSIIYYGFPFPNTAYAKLGTGISAPELVEQGLSYYAFTLSNDPSTLMIIGVGLGASFRDRRMAPLALGGVLYLAYILWIGGDFMGGRFFSAPLFLAAALLSQMDWPALGHRTWTLGALAVALSLSGSHAPPLEGEVGDSEGVGIAEAEDGIIDERRYWSPTTGLLSSAPPAPAWVEALPQALQAPVESGVRATLALVRGPVRPMPSHSYANKGRSYRRSGAVGPFEHGAIGFRGFFGGPDVVIVDYFALADPLLARLPARFSVSWRPGHFRRVRPEGYLDAIWGEPSKVANPGLREFDVYLQRITRGPLFDADRWRDIVAMNLGLYDHLIPRDELRFAGIQAIDLRDVSVAHPDGTSYNAPGTVALSAEGLRVNLAGMSHSATIELGLDHRDRYLILYFQGGDELGRVEVKVPSNPQGGLRTIQVRTPKAAARQGFDNLRMFPVPNPKRPSEKFSLGHVRLL